MNKKARQRISPLLADYQGANPRQVAEALIRYRPGKKPNACEEACASRGQSVLSLASQVYNLL